MGFGDGDEFGDVFGDEEFCTGVGVGELLLAGFDDFFGGGAFVGVPKKEVFLYIS